MSRVITDLHPFFTSPVSRFPKRTFTGSIQTLASKILFASLTPFASLGGYDLLRGLYFAEKGHLAIGDAALAGYILLGLLLWIALLGVTDRPGGGQIVSRLVWGAHAFFNMLSIPFWIFWPPFQNQSALGFEGLGWLANLAAIPVLAISLTCLLLSFTNTKNNP
jgi:hypothetical protein